MSENDIAIKIKETAEKFGLAEEGVKSIWLKFLHFYVTPCGYGGYGWYTDFHGFLIGYLTAMQLATNTLGLYADQYIDTSNESHKSTEGT